MGKEDLLTHSQVAKTLVTAAPRADRFPGVPGPNDGDGRGPYYLSDMSAAGDSGACDCGWG